MNAYADVTVSVAACVRHHTASADCPDAFGYADFALGHFWS
jgi:hypothetical protein